MTGMTVPDRDAIYERRDALVIFNQLGVKVSIDAVDKTAYFSWLDRISERIGVLVATAQIAEKPNARSEPTLNSAVYYDTARRDLLTTGALLRTSCNRITHAFCAFKE